MKIGAREYWGTKLSSDLRDEEAPAGKFREIAFSCGSVVAPLRWALNGSWVRIVEVACEGWKPSDPYFARVDRWLGFTAPRLECGGSLCAGKGLCW